jgi:timeless
VKGLFHQPTEADISNVLKDFTVDFLIKGYNNLVKELHNHLLTDVVWADQ